MTDLVIRPLQAGEEALFDSLPDPGLVGFAAFGEDYARMAAGGGLRPEWTWVALRGAAVVARAAWWGGPHDTAPLALDWFDFTDREAAVELLRRAPLRTEYSLLLPPSWRSDAAVRAAAEARIGAAAEAGLTPLVERYRYRWTPGCGLPERPGRLELRPEPDDAAILAAFRRVHQGTLDAHARRTVERSGLDAAAQEQLDLLRWKPGPREWWRLAYTPGGELAGLCVPARNHGDHVIGYIGVVPEHRGRGHAYELLAEATHLLAAQGAERIVAATDTTNTPMAAAFARAGYPVWMHRIDMVPDTV
ncbi:GNAT family N-acetyltransferase [Allonocardiopsis opalescens]|uniref:RimJ/RimL family protein N-acetyltransferase n=1 Tax=Allonocardiopsis opalescens TaxID=1144618 RepID=A0A2T0PUD6_9ACTN|nr:GNAT family N-acetyltransferase [Allonocardiopsis opalescens]PRX92514.1 RimJ/RimL family protein N-acetyltransferase [Allonocardiopsis opalescens]